MIIENIVLFEKAIKTLKKTAKNGESLTLRPTEDLGHKQFAGVLSDFEYHRADYDTCFMHTVHVKFTVKERLVNIYPFLIALAKKHRDSMEGWKYHLENRKGYIFSVEDFNVPAGVDAHQYKDLIFDLKLEAMESKGTTK